MGYEIRIDIKPESLPHIDKIVESFTEILKAYPLRTWVGSEGNSIIARYKVVGDEFYDVFYGCVYHLCEYYGLRMMNIPDGSLLPYFFEDDSLKLIVPTLSNMPDSSEDGELIYVIEKDGLKRFLCGEVGDFDVFVEKYGENNIYLYDLESIEKNLRGRDYLIRNAKIGQEQLERFKALLNQ